jgi:hypothetical protein
MSFKQEIENLRVGATEPQGNGQGEVQAAAETKQPVAETKAEPQVTKEEAKELTLEEILARLKGVVKDELLRQMIKEIAKLKKAVSKTAPREKLDAEYYPPKEFDLIYNLVKEGHYVLLFGDAGCGKSLLAKQIAKAMNKEFVPIPLGGGVRYKQLFGGDVILADGSSTWKPSKFLEAIQTPSVILLDEIFGVEPDVLAGLNGLLEPSTRCIQTPGGMFKLHPECSIIATSNINGRSPSPKYTGQNKTDESLLDRFWVVYMDYDKEVERKLGEQVPDGMRLVNAVWELRAKCRSLGVEFNVSTRRLNLGLKAMAQGLFRDSNGNLMLDELMKFLFYNNMTVAERNRLGITI